MKALILGLVVILVAILAVLPAGLGLGWGEDVMAFLRGVLPVTSAFIGLILIFAGIADIKDRAEAKKEEERK